MYSSLVRCCLYCAECEFYLTEPRPGLTERDVVVREWKKGGKVDLRYSRWLIPPLWFKEHWPGKSAALLIGWIEKPLHARIWHHADSTCSCLRLKHFQSWSTAKIQEIDFLSKTKLFFSYLSSTWKNNKLGSTWDALTFQCI